MKSSIVLSLMASVLFLGAIVTAPAEARHCSKHRQFDRYYQQQWGQNNRRFERSRRNYMPGYWGQNGAYMNSLERYR